MFSSQIPSTSPPYTGGGSLGQGDRERFDGVEYTAGAAVSFPGKSQFTDFCAQTGQIKVRFLSKSQISKANIVNNAKNPRYIVQLEVVSIQGFILYLWS